MGAHIRAHSTPSFLFPWQPRRHHPLYRSVNTWAQYPIYICGYTHTHTHTTPTPLDRPVRYTTNLLSTSEDLQSSSFSTYPLWPSVTDRYPSIPSGRCWWRAFLRVWSFPMPPQATPPLAKPGWVSLPVLTAAWTSHPSTGPSQIMTPTHKSPLPSRYLEASLLTQLPTCPHGCGNGGRGEGGGGVPANLETGGHRCLVTAVFT